MQEEVVAPLLKPDDSVTFWPKSQVVDLPFVVPVLRDEHKDQRARWPGGAPPDWRSIKWELEASRSAYFLLRRRDDGRSFIEILTGRVIVRTDVTSRAGKNRLWLSGGGGVRFASNHDRRPFLAQGRPVRNGGIAIVSLAEFRVGFESHRRYETGSFVGEIIAQLSAAREDADTGDGGEFEEVKVESELHLLRSLETFVDAEHELEEQTARAQPGFTFTQVRPEPRRSRLKHFLRFRLLEGDHRRLAEAVGSVKMLAIESADGERVLFEIEDVEPESGLPEIVVSTTDQAGGSSVPTTGTLVCVALDTLLKVRKAVIEDLRFGRANNRWLVSLAAGNRRIVDVPIRPYTPPVGPFAPNPSQIEAISKGLATDDYVLVLGPPGTGKTTVINSWVEELVGAGKRVLITSQNNQAVDNVLERVARDRRFTCVRIGNEARVSSSVRDLLIDNCAAELQRTLLATMDARAGLFQELEGAFRETLARLDAEPESDLREALARCSKSIAATTPLPASLEIGADDWTMAVSALTSAADALEEEQRLRDEYLSRGGWGWLFHRWKAYRHRRRADAQKRQIEAQRLVLQPFAESALKRLEAIGAILGAWRTALNEARQQALYPLLLRLVDVVGATCMGINTNRFFRDSVFDVVIVDESGQIQLHNLIVPLSKAERVILVGDHKQLPPVVSPELEAEIERRALVEPMPPSMDLLRKSWFEIMWPRTPATRRAMLDTQFRCPSNISDFISDAFYNGAYFASPAMKAKRPILPDFQSTMVFIDTSALPFARRGERTRRGADREEVLGNPCESEIVLAVLELIGDRLPEIAAKGEIGIIVPYKNHVAEVVQLVNSARRRGRLGSLSTPAAELVSSVDGYQGQERDVIIHAFTRSNPRGAVGFLQDWRRLNVGMTRAKRQLIMVGDLSTLSAAPRRAEAMDAEFKIAMALLRRRLQSDGQLVPAASWMNDPDKAPRYE